MQKVKQMHNTPHSIAGVQKFQKKHWKEFSGILVSDGYTPYRTVFYDNVKQRCTAARCKISGKKIKRHTSKNSLWKIFRCVTSCKSLEYTETFRETTQKTCERSLLKQTDYTIVRYLKGDTEMIQFGKKLKTVRDSLFTFVMFHQLTMTQRIQFEDTSCREILVDIIRDEDIILF